MDTETLDKLYLEWSLFTSARNHREASSLDAIRTALEFLSPPPEIAVPGWVINAKRVLAVALRELENTDGH